MRKARLTVKDHEAIARLLDEADRCVSDAERIMARAMRKADHSETCASIHRRVETLRSRCEELLLSERHDELADGEDLKVYYARR